MGFASRLTRVREQVGISKNRLAKLAGLSQPFITELESGRKQPAFDTIEKICHGLGITLSDFFADQATELPLDLRRMLDVAQKLTPLQRELVTSVMKEMAKDNQAKC